MSAAIRRGGSRSSDADPQIGCIDTCIDACVDISADTRSIAQVDLRARLCGFARGSVVEHSRSGRCSARVVVARHGVSKQYGMPSAIGRRLRALRDVQAGSCHENFIK